MALPGSILVCVNGSSSSEQALAWAVDRAKTRQEEITLACVVNHAFSSQVYGRSLDPMANAAQVLEAATAEIQRMSPTTTVAPLLSVGSVRRKIIDESWQRSVVVLGTDRSYNSPGPSFGTLPLAVAAHAYCPTVVVPNLSSSNRSGIVAGVDGSRAARSVIRIAWQEAGEHHQHLEVINAWRTPDTFVGDERDRLTPVTSFLEARQKLLDRLSGELGNTGNFVSTRVQEGEPARVLVEAARHAELLVIGSHSRHSLSAPFLGSVSRDVLLNISSPTMVVPAAHLPF